MKGDKAMINALLGLLLAAAPVLLVIGLLQLAGWRDRVREATFARQVRLTDAIDAELGLVTAPIVTKRLGHPWQVEMAVSFSRPASVVKLIGIVHRVLPEPYELVLTPQEDVSSIAPPRLGVNRQLRAA